MESVGYMIIYFLNGTLPWQGIKCADKKQKYELILQKKTATTIDRLCEGLPGLNILYITNTIICINPLL
jgi:hypothetical protein